MKRKRLCKVMQKYSLDPEDSEYITKGDMRESLRRIAKGHGLGPLQIEALTVTHDMQKQSGEER